MENVKEIVVIRNILPKKKDYKLEKYQKTITCQKKEWCCQICKSDKKYLLKNKWNHIQTKTHQNNLKKHRIIFWQIKV